MKPISLEMVAFGPYGDRAHVDFEPLADVGLFVVSGPTGAGKSTIFDAICFALYGSLSGARAGHSDVRSHYAEPHAKCSVALVFDAEGQRWRVTRQPSQTVLKRRGTGTTVQPASAVLERWDGSDWAPDTTKVRDVTARTRALVGLSLEQFERVVLLPQGKFADVLNAKTSERSELLRTLFGSEIFDRAADVLADQAKEGERSLRAVNEQRAVFHQRVVGAIEQIELELDGLPDSVQASLADTDDTGESGQRAAETQLSFLDPTDSDDATDTPAEPSTEPSVVLEVLANGPIARLADVTERRRTESELARAELDRAKDQRRSIEQRAEATRLLSVLEARTDEMASLAARSASARRLLGLDEAIADRARLEGSLASADAVLAGEWQKACALVPSVLGDEPHTLLGSDSTPSSPAPAVVAELLDLVSGRLAALDLVAEDQDRVARLENEFAEVSERIAHLDDIDQRALVRAAEVETEVSALLDEQAQLLSVGQSSDGLADQLVRIEATIDLRRRLDEAMADQQRFASELEIVQAEREAANQAVEAADAQIEALGADAAQLDSRRALAAAAERRCERRAEFDEASAALADSTTAAEQARAFANDTFAAFVNQTAPRLAAKLVPDEPCPVCGSCEHPTPADVDDIGSEAAIDARAVERASSAASAAEAEQSRWQTSVANLISDDPALVELAPDALADAAQAAIAALRDAEDAQAKRNDLVAGRPTLQQRIGEAQAKVELAEHAVGESRLRVRELEGAMGDSTAIDAATLAEDRRSTTNALALAEQANERLLWISTRQDEIERVSADEARLSRQRAVDRATAAERLGQLSASIESTQAKLADVLQGETLAAKLERVHALRSSLTSWQELTLEAARIETAFESLVKSCATIVASAGFDNEQQAVADVLPLATIEQNEAAHGRWSNEITAHRATLATLAAHELPEQAPDLDRLAAHAIEAGERHREISERFASIDLLLHRAREDMHQVAALDAAHAEQRAEHETMQRVANVVRGQNSRRLSLENWVLSVYLHDVVEHANLHLATMSNGRYRLAVQDAPASQVGQHGLDLVVDDAHTGRLRASMSLSGGETFQASLALALGLADVVMLGRAGLHLDALFVDEGFGSLDADAIDQAITVLDGLRSRGSMVGVITHVEALKSALPVAIDVQPRRDQRGSTIRQVA